MRALLFFGALVLGPSALLGQRTQQPAPFVLGVTEKIHSTVLSEDRILNITLPLGYSPDSAARYPVIYLLDGSADEDIIHVTGAVQFASFEWINWLPPSIVVGIANVDRKRDLTYPTTIAKDKVEFPTTGGSATFMKFIGEELIPFIDSNYRTLDARLLIGQSLGGLFAAEVLMKKPELFHAYMIISPSVWWDNGSLLELEPAFVTDPAKAPKEVYIAVGKEGKVMVNGAKKLAALTKKSIGTKVGFSYLPKFDHANILHQAVVEGFRLMGETK